MEETEEYSNAEQSSSADAYSLMALKIGLQRLHVVRKLFLCSLLALDADGGKSDFARWTAAIKMMRHVAKETNAMAISVDSDLWEEQGRLDEYVQRFNQTNQLQCRFSNDSYPKTTPDATKGEDEKANEKAGLSISRDSRSSSKDAFTSRRIR